MSRKKQREGRLVIPIGRIDMYQVIVGGTRKQPMIILRDLSTKPITEIAIHHVDSLLVENAMQMANAYIEMPE